MLTVPVEIPYGDSLIKVTVPSRWLGEILLPPPTHPLGELDSLIQNALDNPIDTPRIEQIAKPGQQVAILVDDHTRRTPARQMLSRLLARLVSAGIRQREICILLALGSHRAMEPEEVEDKLGKEIASRYEIINTPGTELAEFRHLGAASSDIPVWAHRRAAQADLRIGLGTITPHMDAGFSGGAKIVLPGVCSDETVNAFHARSAHLPGNPLGDVNAPLRRDLESAVAELAPLDFILNAIPTLNHQTYTCVAGHPIKAHRIGAAHAGKVFQISVRRRYPIVVAGCHPYEHDLWQSMKGLWCGDLLTADGGSLVLLTSSTEGARATPRLPGYIGMDPEALLSDLDSGRAADQKSAATGVMVGRMKKRIEISLVSSGLNRTDARSMGLSYFKSAEQALEQAAERLQPADLKGSIGIIPYAGLVLPLVDSRSLS